jgi:DNA-binding CsgD family transcriptional regulator
MASGVKHGSGTVKEAENPRVLSQFECDILAQMLIGKTDAEAALVLGVSKATVSKYALVAVRKLRATNRVHAVARIFAAVTAEGAPANEEVRDLMRDLFDAAGAIEQRHGGERQIAC